MGDALVPTTAGATDDKPSNGGKDKDKDKDKPKPSRPPRRWLAALGVKHEDEDKVLANLDENLRITLLHVSNAADPPISTTLPAQVVLWTWGLIVLITISLYTGATAAILTTSSLTGSIESRTDLIGKAVGTYEDYVDKLSAIGLPTIGYKWDTDEDEARMLGDLRSGRISALVIDANFVRYVDGRHCDLTGVGQEFLINDVGFGLSSSLPVALTESLNAAIISVIEDGTMEELYNVHVNNLGGPCSESHSAAASKNGAIRVDQVAGLWCVLALAVLVGFLLLGLKWLQRRRAAAQRLALLAARSFSRSIKRTASRDAGT
jgi:ABC-type amino acid transport substrate-binding protein